jgi:hypothetical protein
MPIPFTRDGARATKDTSWVQWCMVENPVSDDRLRLVGEHAGSLRVWSWLNVEIVHWYGKPSGPAARKLCELTDQILAELGASTKISFIHLVVNKIEMPDAEARAVIVESSKSHEQRSALSAIVVHGHGFWASALRGFATGVTFLIPKTVQVRICGNPWELIPWFPDEHLRRSGVAIDANGLVSVLSKVQAQPATARSGAFL